MPSTDKFHDECGVVAIYSHPEAEKLAYLGLHALQHRGQESAGIVTSDGMALHVHKAMGLVADIFVEEVLAQLRGTLAIGHTRYSTAGDSALLNAQPMKTPSNPSQAQAPTLALAALSLAALGIFGAFGPFWAMPTAFLGGSAAAGGIALINSIGNLGGFVGPSLIGLVHESTQSFAGGLLALAASLLVAGLLALCVSRASLAGSAPAEPGAGAAGSGGAAGAPTLAAGGASTGARSGVP